MDDRYRKGIEAFNCGQFSLSRDYLDLIWQECRSGEQGFYQALVEMAEGFHQYINRNTNGASYLLEKSLTSLKPYPSHFQGVDLEKLALEIHKWVQRIGAIRASGSYQEYQDYPQLTIENIEVPELVNPYETENLLKWDRVSRGQYEIYFLKWNVPEQGIALWVRYTITVPKDQRLIPASEVWCVFFDRKNPSQNAAWKEAYPLEWTKLSKDHWSFIAGNAVLSLSGARGILGRGFQSVFWDVTFTPKSPPFRHFPMEWMYRAKFPKTKLSAPLMSMSVSGKVVVQGNTYEFTNASGHQGHIWGTRYAKRWAWSNCNIFQGSKDALFEALTAQIHIGPFSSPPMTIVFFRMDGTDYRFNRIHQWFRNKSRYDLEHWNLSAEDRIYRIDADIRSRITEMVGVRYFDPSGDWRICHNTKLADMELKLFQKSATGWTLKKVLTATGTAAFEVVEPKQDPRVEVKI